LRGRLSTIVARPRIEKEVVNPSSPNVVEVLRSTLKGLEKSEELAADDPALNELKGSILSRITELEVAKTEKAPTRKRILWISQKACVDAEATADAHAHAGAEPDGPCTPADSTSQAGEPQGGIKTSKP
jgi:hypothetical protein